MDEDSLQLEWLDGPALPSGEELSQGLLIKEEEHTCLANHELLKKTVRR